ncbi:MAG: hypothetical protein J0M30_09565 [Chitinophagales bacterium]|nr:hypothetical protein [Chitinophagales bacterium]
MKTNVSIFLTLVFATMLRWWLGLTNPLTGIDDANIYFVYVRNLVEGHGFVYIPGGERVEGFTSILWVLILSVLYLIKFIPFEWSVFVLCFFITCRTLTVLHKYIKDETGESYLAWGAVLFLLLTPGFLDWNVFALMDTCLWIYAVVHGTILLIKEKRSTRELRYLTLICLLLPFIRPEGLLFTFALGGLLILSFWWKGKGATNAGKIPPVHFFMPLIFGLIGFLTITIFRIVYFGYPVPNTFYAKVSMSLMGNIRQAFFYFYDSLRHTTFIPYLLFPLSLIYFFIKKGFWGALRDFKGITLILFIFFFTVYPFLSGGDHFKYSRFFQTAYPLILLFFVHTTGMAWVRLPKITSAVLAVLLLMLLNGNSTDEASFQSDGLKNTLTGYIKKWKPDIFNRSQLQGEFDIAMNGRNIGNTLNDVFSPADSFPSLGVTAAGGVAYTYKGTIIDVLGLNNLEMAHAEKIKTGVKNHGSFSPRIFYKQKPALFLTWPDPLTREMNQNEASARAFDGLMRDSTGFINRICRNIFADSLFNQKYSFGMIKSTKGHIYSYMDNNLPAYLEQHGLLVVFIK